MNLENSENRPESSTEPSACSNTGDSESHRQADTSTEKGRKTGELTPSALRELLTPLTLEITNLRKELESYITEASESRSSFSHLHELVKDYREDFLFKNITRRIYLDLIRLFDRLDESMGRVEKNEDIDYTSLITSLRTEVAQILKRQEVTLIDSDSEIFDEKFQVAIDTRPTQNPDEDKKVIQTVREGFMFRESVLRPSQVIIARFENRKEKKSCLES